MANYPEELRVAVATENADKVGAASEAAQKVYSLGRRKRAVNARGIPGVSSGVNDQPYGLKETEQGARNRMANAKRQLAEESARGGDGDYDVVVAMESGIMRERGGHRDRAVVIVEDREGRQGKATSRGVKFPEHLVEEARQAGFDHTTVGSLIARDRGGSPQDPHLTLTGKPRRNYLREATARALRQIKQ